MTRREINDREWRHGRSILRDGFDINALPRGELSLDIKKLLFDYQSPTASKSDKPADYTPKNNGLGENK